jgi:circadian clock protein KaiB
MAESDVKSGLEYKLKLFVSGASPNSVRAIHNLRAICDEHLSKQYTLEIIDVYQDTSLAQLEQIVALPLLIRKFPLPERKLIGDMSNTQKVLTGLGIVY